MTDTGVGKTQDKAGPAHSRDSRVLLRFLRVFPFSSLVASENVKGRD